MGTQLPHGKGHNSPPLFGPWLLWPNGPSRSATAELLFCTATTETVLLTPKRSKVELWKAAITAKEL